MYFTLNYCRNIENICNKQEYIHLFLTKIENEDDIC